MNGIRKQNLGAVSVGPNKVEIQSRPLSDEPLGPNEVLVQLIVNGLCGSDCFVWEVGARKPIVLGHEGAGIITEIGSEVKDRYVGQRVAVEPGYPCYK